MTTNTSAEREAEIREFASAEWKNGGAKIPEGIPSFTRDLLAMLDEARALLDHATHFEFENGVDCYERCHNGKATTKYTGHDGREYKPGDSWWEARGCVEEPGVQWVATQRDALKAIGH